MSPSKKPDHYSRLSPQPIEVIEGWDLSFHLGAVVKYIARSPFKGDALRDLRKAKWYLDREIELREACISERPVPPPPEQV